MQHALLVAARAEVARLAGEGEEVVAPAGVTRSVPAEFSRPEVLEILREYYAGVEAGGKA